MVGGFLCVGGVYLATAQGMVMAFLFCFWGVSGFVIGD